MATSPVDDDFDNDLPTTFADPAPSQDADYDFLNQNDDAEIDNNVEVPEPDYNLMLREETHQNTLQMGHMLSQALTVDIDRFDQRFAKNWAGPSHWKFAANLPSNKRKAPEASSSHHADGEEGAEPKPKLRVRKEPFRINFFDAQAPGPFQKADQKQICLAQVTLAKASPGDNLLPPDQRYSLRDLLSFFIRPEWTVRELAAPAASGSDASFVVESNPIISQLNRSLALAPSEAFPTSGEILGYHYPTAEEDQHQQMPDHAGDDGGYDDYHDDDYAMPIFSTTDQSQMMPYQTQGAQSAAGQENPYGNRYQKMSAQLQNLNLIDDANFRVRRTGMNLNALQSTLNVRQLKDDIWSELKEQLDNDESLSSSSSSNIPSSSSSQLSDDQNDTPKGSFQELLENIPSRVQREDQLAQVSVPFCFICLLHLANEKSLVLSQDQNNLNQMLSSLSISQDLK